MVFSNVDATPLRYLSSESRHVADDLKLTEPIPKKRKLGSKASMPIVANITEETRAIMAAENASINERRTIKKIQAIHDNSNAKSHGEAYLFFDRGHKGLGKMVLKKDASALRIASVARHTLIIPTFRRYSRATHVQ